jgi:O-methyltransferase involved in polyketide biosynthesis
MSAEKIDFRTISDDGVTWTLLGTLYLRAWESRLEPPILGDRYAAEAIERIDYDFAKLKRRVQPASSQFIVGLRGRQLDDWCRAFLGAHPGATVLQLGCGLDSRMLRLDPEASLRWFDVDTPEVIGLRRRLFAERGGYRMIGSSVTDEGWLDRIPADRPVLIIAEGLLPYLTPEEARVLVRRLTAHFRTGEFLFDGLASWMVRLNKAFRWDGSGVERWDPLLTLAERVSITKHHQRIPVRGYRALYRLMDAVPALHFDVLYRLTF